MIEWSTLQDRVSEISVSLPVGVFSNAKIPNEILDL